MQVQALPGFRDFYPDDFALRAHLFRAFRAVAARYGFEEWDGPPLEPLDLYTKKSGDEIVGQLYAFTDKGGREVALRPELTPTLARMVAARANGLKKPIRWFAIPQLFRYERQQRGRLREHFQLNCDLIGEPGPLADAEVIALAVDIMRELGLGPGDIRVRLSDRRLLNEALDAAAVPEAARPHAYQAIDKLGRAEFGGAQAQFVAAGGDVAVLERLQAAGRVRTLPEVRAALGLAPSTDVPLARVIGALEAMGLGAFVDVDVTIVRGLAYYTGTVFELFDAGRSLRAICGGGRYDGLVLALGGVDLPCVGFGMGDVVLGELLKERGLAPAGSRVVDVFVAAVTPEDEPHVLALARALRDHGCRTEYALGGQSLPKQLKLADARGARLAVVIGPDDRAAGTVMLKDLAAKQQRALPAATAAAEIAAALGGTTVAGRGPQA
ncbi:MAG: histidine--tRNA ligase [Gemmatimonadales bacterium]|nr:histidine--tRNA ligase [Gemmatimonadales bacterium]